MIAVPSALLYVLGVVVFWLRIASEYDGINLGTTWYAASLVPRSTAAASGIEAISRGFVYGALAGAVILFIAHVVIYVQARQRENEKKGENEENVGFFSASLFVPFLLTLAAILVMLLNFFFRRRQRLWPVVQSAYRSRDASARGAGSGLSLDRREQYGEYVFAVTTKSLFRATISGDRGGGRSGERVRTRPFAARSKSFLPVERGPERRGVRGERGRNPK